MLLEDRRAVAHVGRWESLATERDLLKLLLNQALTEAGDTKLQRLQVSGGSLLEPAEAGLELMIENAPS